ncbi:MAG TPA: glycine oxidase ThiO [Solirubrobacteraceae bacterium]|jgi:glycine oxidase|nr:glycine oxidase ThiO [Solirubrobacteraceae bacterium]
MGSTDVLVIGGGAIGLAVAWRSAQAGLDVVLCDQAELGSGASHVAAGMLGPIAEAGFGQAAGRLLELGLDSAALWPEFAAELATASGTQSCLRSDGTLIVARDADEAAGLERELAFRTELGLEIVRLRPSEARRLEPGLAPTIRLAGLVPTEQTVDPRWLVDALILAARAAGAELRDHSPVDRLLRESPAAVDSATTRVADTTRPDEHARQVTGAQLRSGERILAPSVVLAAGAWSGGLADVAVRPVKGQIMRLRDPRGPGLVDRVVRFGGGYLVPRGDGRYVLGATVEERGFDRTVTAGGLHELLRDASELVPGVLELEVTEFSAGLRPGTPDNLPMIGRDPATRLITATGHHRNGILLTPVTADLVIRAVSGDQFPAREQALVR